MDPTVHSRPTLSPSLDRRRFLAGSLAAAAALARPCQAPGAEAAVDPNRFVLLSDTHVCADPERVHSGVKPCAQFLGAREGILAIRPRPASIIISGDCAFIEGRPDDYDTLAGLVEPLKKAAPVHLALGNHDHRENCSRRFPAQSLVPGKRVGLISSPHADWYLLDSLDKTNKVWGLLGDAQLAWLRQTLAENRDKPAILVLHHNLEFDGRKTGLLDTDALVKIAAGNKQVKAIVYGHTHRWGVADLDGVHLLNVPTLVWLFDKQQPRAWVDVAVESGGLALGLFSLDPQHPAHRQKVRLTWRGG